MILAKLRDTIFHPRTFRYRDAFINSPRRAPGKPIDVTLELASHCNMACQYCYHSDQPGLPFAKGFMALDTARTIIEQAANAGAFSMKFNWRGEPTTNPHFAEIVKYSAMFARGDVLMERFTNSNFKFRTDRLDIFDGLASMTKVKVSYDSFRKDVFEAQRTGGDHALTTANIDRFYYWPGRKTEIVIQAVITKRNADEDILGQVKQRWPKATLSVRNMVEGRVNKDLSGDTVERRDASERQSCIQAHARLIFGWNGLASPCCPAIDESLVLGDIKTESVTEIWNGFKARRLRESLIDKSAFEKDPCKNCSSFETFAGFKPNWES